jgi:hypothetical protein
MSALFDDSRNVREGEQAEGGSGCHDKRFHENRSLMTVIGRSAERGENTDHDASFLSSALSATFCQHIDRPLWCNGYNQPLVLSRHAICPNALQRAAGSV